MIFILITLLLVGFAILYMKNPGSLFYTDLHMDPTLDWNYSFKPETIEKINISIDENGFRWPSDKFTYQSCFLEIILESKGKGLYFSPSLWINEKEQVFEAKTKGKRYVNLSSMHPEPGEYITLKGSGLTWKKQQATLLFFNQSVSSNDRILIISPHPDDAELAAFSLFRPHQTLVVTLTQGDAGINNFARLFPDPATGYKMKGFARALDSLSAPQLGGIPLERCLHLGYFDTRLKEMKENPSQPFTGRYSHEKDLTPVRSLNHSSLLLPDIKEATWNNLLADLHHLINTFQPTIIVTPHPFMDDHLDHQMSTLATMEALTSSSIKEGRFFFYNNHSALSPGYPLGGADTLMSVPPWTSSMPPAEGIYSPTLTTEQLGLKTIALDSHKDLRAHPRRIRHLKDKLAHIYRSIPSEQSYFRQALREHELFIVYPFQDREKFQN